MESSEIQLPKPTLLLIALIQGLLLLTLHELVEFEVWLHESPSWLYALYAMVIIGPLMLLLSLERGSQWRKIASWVLAFTLICGGLGYYTGQQILVEVYRSNGSLLPPLIATLIVATFKALMYIQHRASGEPFQYSFLFLFSWRNALSLSLSLLFTLAVWGILMLWGQLFEAINIDFFMDLFTETWFFYPALSMANGFGVIIFRNLTSVIDTITRILQALMKFLLVFLVLVSILFLIALVFTGLSPLWETGIGSALILIMQGLLLFFLNAVYQDDPDTRPYPLIIHRFIYSGIAILPIYSAIVFYGLYLRLEQYGWTPSRGWAFLIWFLFAVFSFGYLWGIVKRRDNWLRHLSWVNVRAGLLVLVLALLVNSPILDFRKIAVASQLNRLTNGTTAIEDFDIRFFRYQLGKPGYDALQKIKKDYEVSHPFLAKEIENIYRSQEQKTALFTQERMMASMTHHGSTPPPPELESALFAYTKSNQWRFTEFEKFYLLQVDLDKDGKDEYLLLQNYHRGVQSTLFYQDQYKWEYTEMGYQENPISDKIELQKFLEQGNWQLTENRWRSFSIDGMKFSVGK